MVGAGLDFHFGPVLLVHIATSNLSPIALPLGFYWRDSSIRLFELPTESLPTCALDQAANRRVDRRRFSGRRLRTGVYVLTKAAIDTVPSVATGCSWYSTQGVDFGRQEEAP